jgi:hypothetical protein
LQLNLTSLSIRGAAAAAVEQETISLSHDVDEIINLFPNAIEIPPAKLFLIVVAAGCGMCALFKYTSGLVVE